MKKSALALTLVLLTALIATNIAKAEEKVDCNTNIKERLDTLLSAKDTLDISADTKAEAEFSARKDLLSTILSCSKEETIDLKEKINILSPRDKEDQELKNRFTTSLDNFIKYYEEKEKLFSDKKDNENDIQDLAKDILSWRKDVYNLEITHVVDFVFIYKQREVNEIAGKRLQKINTSLKTILSVQNNQIKALLNKSSIKINNAKKLTEKAHEVLANQLIEEQKIETATSTISTNPPEEKVKEKIPRDLVKSALDEIKSAYEDFFEISRLVSKILGY